MPADRLSTLDGFRAVAVVAVIMFHFFSRWTPPLNAVDFYPYGNQYSAVAIFHYGYLGVQFFFVISGFVISMTLAASKGPRDFAVRRISRLWPAMLLCSTLTFVTLIAVPHAPFAAHSRNYIPSLLFLDPGLVGRVLGRGIGWMDGAYWSLYVEVRFYFWAALIYFSSPRRFLELFAAVLTTLLLLSLAPQLITPKLPHVLELLLFPAFLPWFIIGIGFYYLHSVRRDAFVHFTIVASMGMILLEASLANEASAAWTESLPVQVTVLVAVVAGFYAFVYRPRWVALFSWWPASTVGAASYSLYLMHQYIGLTLLRYLTDRLGVPGEIMAGLVILLMIGASLVIYRYWEIPGKRLMLRLLQPARSAAVSSPARPQLEARSRWNIA